MSSREFVPDNPCSRGNICAAAWTIPAFACEYRLAPEGSPTPEGTDFCIKEFDVPLVHTPSNEWSNWFGGKPREYDVKNLKPGNNWLAESFEEWVRIVDESR